MPRAQAFYELTYNLGNGEIYVINAGVNAVSAISVTSNAVVANITVGNTPEEVARDSHKGEIFAIHVVDGTVSIISDSTKDHGFNSDTWERFL